MMEISLAAVIAATLAATVAWYLRGLRAEAVQASLEIRAAGAEKGLADRIQELDALKSVHVRVVDQHREEATRRAVAEERAAQLPDLQLSYQIKEGNQVTEQQGVHVSSPSHLLSCANKRADHVGCGVCLACAWRSLNGQDAGRHLFDDPNSCFQHGLARFAKDSTLIDRRTTQQ
jgi:hypothetical protein